VDDGYPISVAGNWAGLAEKGFDRPTAAVNLEAGKIYLFQGSKYVRYDVHADRVDDGYPLEIADRWPGMGEAGFGADLDAAVSWGDGSVFFFKGDQYVRYNLSADKVDAGYPLKIGDQWPGMAAAGFGSGLDAAVKWGDGNVYFFKGDNYVRYDMAADTVPEGYPRAITDFWPGLTAGFRAATDLFDATEDLWLESATRMPGTKNGPAYIVTMPWRGVLHTTEGGSIDGALGSFAQTNFWPTLTIEPNTFKIVQHYSLNRGARALSDHATPENAARCVQIEIVGFAAQTPSWAPEQLAFIRDVVRQIEDLVPIGHYSERTFLDANGVNSTPSNRMSVEEWKRFGGWCGHQHVPGESHWDPGAIDIATILS
jgi:hemopexin